MADVRDTFAAFFEGWLQRQQTFLEQLLTISTSPPQNNDKERRQLVEQVIGHYMQYYQEKYKAANDDIFLLYSPPWFSSFERTFLWISGFRPSLVFKFIAETVEDFLSAEQKERIEVVKIGTKKEEGEIEDAMAKIQESVAAPPLSNLVRMVGRLEDGEVSDMDTAMEELKAAMLTVMGKADCLRGSTVWKVLEILSPEQTVKLLAGAAQFQLQTRRLGLERDSQIAAAASTSSEIGIRLEIVDDNDVLMAFKDADHIDGTEAQPPPPPPDNEANEPEIPNVTNEHDPLDAEPEEEYHSAHSDSEVEGEPDSSDDEFQPDGATQHFVNQTSNVYNENESGEHPQPPVVVRDLELKMQFNNMKEFRDYIRTYAILKNFVWEYVKNDSDRARLKCHDKECNWLCYAKQKRNEATIVVKTFRGRTRARGSGTSGRGSGTSTRGRGTV
ncbi:hypothetical protein LguiB_019843 [Lonicera macranthoides]